MHLYRIDLRTAHKLRLVPRVPANRMPAEDETQPRVCAAPTINGCIRALVANDNGRIKQVDGEHFHRLITRFGKERLVRHWNVFETDIDESLVVKPTVKQVPDVRRTKEVWIPQSVLFRRVGPIRMVDSPSFYDPGSGPHDEGYWRGGHIYWTLDKPFKRV